MTDSHKNVLQFEDFELDIASREMRRDGEVVPLEPRVFSLLVYLYENRHRAVDKDEIQDAVWKDMIVSETALTRAIMKARRAANDSADKQAVIRTVHGHGYQFVAKPAEEAPTISPQEETPKQRVMTPPILALVVVLVIAGFAALLWPDNESPMSVRLAVMPVQNSTSDPEYDWTRLGLMGFANDLITRSAEINILAASDVIRFSERHGLPDDQDDERAAADLLQLRDSYGASHMLLSTLEKNAGVFRLNYRLFKQDGNFERGTMVGAEPTELMRGMVRSVGATLGNLVRPIDEITVVSEDPFINEAYSRGLSLSLEGRCPEAQQLFEVVTSSRTAIDRADFEWASCARIMGHWQEAEARFEEILDNTPVEPSTTLRALAFNGLGTVYIRTGRGDLARETFDLGLSEAISAGDGILEAKILNSLAIEAKNRREHDEARDLLARAALAHTEAGGGALPGQLPAALANIDMAEGKFDQAEEHLEQALAAFRALGDRRNEAMMLNNYGYLRRLQGRMTDAEPLHLQSLTIRREIGDVVGQGRILGMLSTIYMNDGRLEEARDAATEAFRIASDANDKLFMATSLAQLAQIELSFGDVAAARLRYVESNEIFQEIGDHSRVAQTAIRLAQIDLKSGDLAAAEESVRDVLSVSMREGLQEPAIEAMELEGDIRIAQSDPERAISAYNDALDYIDESGFVSRKIGIVTKLAYVLLDQNDLEAVDPLIGYMIEQGNESASLKVRAHSAFVQGEIEQSVSLLESARSTAEDDWTEADEVRLAEYREALGEQSMGEQS